MSQLILSPIVDVTRNVGRAQHNQLSLKVETDVP